MFKRAGVPHVFKVHPDAGHDVSWWPQERAALRGVSRRASAQAHPERISWETERTDRYNRFRWLVIDRLGQAAVRRALNDVNTYQPIPVMERTLFDHEKPSGRVDADRTGNAFEVKTRGVQAFTLLLSPDAIDFTKPVQVTVNGKVAHDGDRQARRRDAADLGGARPRSDDALRRRAARPVP